MDSTGLPATPNAPAPDPDRSARTGPTQSTPAPRTPWLIIIDPQRIFADPSSDWAAPTFPDAMENIGRLADAAGPARTLVTRWLPTADRSTAWGEYFAAWPFADVPADDPLYELIDAARGLSTHPSIDEPTFGKWGPQLADAVGADPHLLVTGVSTDCCVLTTVLAAADAGIRVSVVRDGCAASTPENGMASLQVMELFPPQVDVIDIAKALTLL